MNLKMLPRRDPSRLDLLHKDPKLSLLLALQSHDAEPERTAIRLEELQIKSVSN